MIGFNPVIGYRILWWTTSVGMLIVVSAIEVVWWFS